MSVRVLEGDCRAVLGTLPSESVQCVVTSPPYWGLRDYGVAGQLGLEKTPDEYVARMVEVFREVRRVLRADGTLWLNLGDSYTGSGKGGNPEDGKQATNKGSQTIGTLYGKTGETARQAAVTNVSRRLCAEQGLAPKNLVGIPWRVAFALQADGWYLRSDIIWHKPNPMPESVTDRPTKSHEYVFLLTKQERYYYDAAAIAEPASENTNARRADLRLTSKQDSYIAQPNNGGQSGLGAFQDSSTRNRRSVWTVATQPFAQAHFATFPPKLIEPCILAGSASKACEHCGAAWVRVVERENGHASARASETYTGQAYKQPQSAPRGPKSNFGPGGSGATVGWEPSCSCPDNTGTARSVVLDPFGGAGTTGLVADRLLRSAVLIELNPEYAKLARERITNDAGLFTDVA